MGLVVDKSILNAPREKYWITYIKQRISKNKNFLGFISGTTGSGKSWSSLSICSDLDPEFGEDRIVFSGVELMTLINSSKLKRGSAILFEEVGVEMNNRNWSSVTNKMLNYLIQTFRHRGFILIMNSPFMDFVDSSIKKLFHAEIATVSIDFKTNECKLKPLHLQWNSRFKKFYYKRLRAVTPEGIVPISFWRVGKPKQELIDFYEKKKREFTDKLNKKILEELECANSAKIRKMANTGRKPLTFLQERVLRLRKQGLNNQQIGKEMGLSSQGVGHHIRSAILKGYNTDFPKKKGKPIGEDGKSILNSPDSREKSQIITEKDKKEGNIPTFIEDTGEFD